MNTSIIASIKNGVSPVINHDRYILYKSFWMPTKHGSVLAVSVPNDIAQQLQSLYALMLQTIITEIWVIILLFIMVLSLRGYREVSKNVGVANVAIWNQRYSPISVASSLLDYRKHIPYYALSWAVFALVAFSGQKLLSIFVSPYLILGQAAPVNPHAVFLPTIVRNATNLDALTYRNLVYPALARAVNALDGVDPFTGNLINLNTADGAVKFGYQLSPYDENNTFIKFDYSYHVTGVDFGLQKLPDLTYAVEGSCRTEYTWYKGGDQYQIADYGRNVNLSPNVSLADPPVLSVNLLSTTDNNFTANSTFALFINSVNRTSYSESYDPWYFTGASHVPGNNSEFNVINGRPPLSCWQTDTWSYHGTNMSTLNFTGSEALQFPSAIQQIIFNCLYEPKVADLGTNLGLQALQSATAASISHYIDANSSSVIKDLQRLVYGSYVATKNIFQETTVSNHLAYSNTSLVTTNAVLQNGSYMPGVGDFIVLGSGFAALSIRFLVAVPVVLLFLLAIVGVVSSNRWYAWPWGHLNAMNATILYTTIDSKNFNGTDEHEWSRSSTAPYSQHNEKARVRPQYHRRNHSYGWSVSSENTTEHLTSVDTQYPGPASLHGLLIDELPLVTLPSVTTGLMSDELSLFEGRTEDSSTFKTERHSVLGN